jgi:hypothetical protein
VTLGGTWGANAAASTSGGGFGFGSGSNAPASSYGLGPVSTRNGGSAVYYGPADGNTQTRQFASVGKENINLLDPLSTSRMNAPIPIDPAQDNSPLGSVARYYSPSTPGGLFAGLLGAVGSTVGGILGQGEAGQTIGADIGKTIEAPLSIAGGVGIQSVPFLAPIIDAANSQIEQFTPYILRDTLKIPTNLGGAFQSILNIPGLVGEAIQRTYAGMSGARGALPDDIQQKIDSGEWTRDRALDELVLSQRGFTNDPIANTVWSILTDPVNWASLGVGAVAGAVEGTADIARIFSSAAAREGSTVAALAGDGSRVGELAKLAQDGQDLSAVNLSRGDLSVMKQAVNHDLLDRVANGEDVPNHLKLKISERIGTSALGPISDTATQNIVYKVADKIAKASDPVNFFSGSRAAQRSMEALHMAASTAVVAALKPNVVRDLTSIADDLAADGGDRIMEAVGTWGANGMQETVAGETANDAARVNAIPKHPTLNTAEATRAQLAGGAYDTNIGKYIETQVEKTKDIRVASLPADQMREQTVNKLAAILQVDPAKVAARVGKVSADMAMAVHGLYYYTKGKVLHTNVMAAIHDAAARGVLPKDIDPHDITMITPRTLTNLRVKELDAAIKAGDVAKVRAFTENYDDFNWMNRQTVKDADLIHDVRDYLDTNRSSLPQEINLKDAAGNIRTDIPQELQDWAKDGSNFEYGLANGIPENAPLDAQWRITHNADGGIKNAQPWLQFWADGIPAAKRVSRWQSMNMSMFRGIRGERILWNQRRRFITDMASKESGNIALPPALADRLFKALMFEAQEGRLLPRGMSPDQMMDAVHGVLEDVKGNTSVYGNVASKLTERQVVTGFLRAMEGDVSLVGATQKFTGMVKARAPGAAGNYWGQLSEKLYPLMRFTLNPVFMSMELVEPYILDYMRGVPLPLRRDAAKYQQGLATYNAIRQYVFASREPDGLLAENAEMNAMRIYQAAEARSHFGAGSVWGRIKGTKPAIAERKQAAAGMEARRIIGDNLYAAFHEIWGDQFERNWGDLAYEYGTVDRAEIAERWLAANLSLADKDGHAIGLTHDLLNLKNVGQGRIRLTTDGSRRGDYTFGDVEQLLDHVRTEQGLDTRESEGLASGEALQRDLRAMTKDDWLSEVSRAGMDTHVGKVSDKAAEDIWRLATGQTVDEFWRGHRATYLRGLAGPTAVATRRARDAAIKATRAFVQGAAAGKNLTEEEFIRLHFDDIPRWAVDAGVLPPQALTDVRSDIGHAILKNEGGDKPYKTWLIRHSINGGVVDSLPPELQRHVDAITAGSESRDMLYLPVTEQAMERLKFASKGLGWGAVGTQYDRVSTSPLRAISAYDASAQHLIRFDRDAVEAERESPAANLKRQKAHDYVLSQDINYGDVPMEVYTENGWVPIQQAVGEVTGVPTPALREGYQRMPWLDELFQQGGEAGATTPWAIDLKKMLTVAEQGATEDYKSSIYANINTFLRGHMLDPDAQHISDDRVRQLVEYLDQSIQKGVLREPGTFHRGVNISRAMDEWGLDIRDEFDRQPGEILQDPAFVSTSDDEAQAMEFAEGGGHKFQSGTNHQGVIIHYELPAGFHMNLIEGYEGEHLLPRDQPFRIIKRVDKPNTYGGGNVIHLTVVPDGEARVTGVNRLMLGDPPIHERNVAYAQHLAATDPAALIDLTTRARPETQEGLREVAQEEIAKAEAARPPEGTVVVGQRRFGRITPEQGLEDIKAVIDEDQLPSFSEAWDDTRYRIEELMHTSDTADEHGVRFDPDEVFNSNDTRALASIAAAMPSRGGRGAVTLFIHTLEQAWQRGLRPATEMAVERESKDAQVALLQTQHLLRGLKYPFDVPNVPPDINDAMDVLLGNSNRRAIGRMDGSMPIVADDAAYEGAGYVTPETLADLKENGVDTTGLTLTSKSDETHAYLVGYYNAMAKAANAEGLGGYKVWTAADMALMAGKAREVRGRVATSMPAQDVASQLRTIPANIYFPEGTTMSWANPVLDLLNEPANRAERHAFMRGVQVGLMQDMRDNFGIVVDGLDDRGIGFWDADTPQPLVPLTMLSSAIRGNDLADIMSYVMRQREVWHFSPVDAVTAGVDAADHDARVTLSFPSSSLQSFSDAQHVAQGLASIRDDIRGATAIEMPNHTWQISFIDDQHSLPRLDDGTVDEDYVRSMVEAAQKGLDQEGLDTDMWVDYGKTYKAGPAIVNGEPDWGGHLDATLSRLASRGVAPDGAVLDRLRAAHDERVQWGLNEVAPKNTRRAVLGDPITTTLEDKRGGQVFGTTTPTGAQSAVVRGFGAADALTGLHELIHVFSIAGMDPSLRDAITREYERYSTDVETAAQALETRAATHTNRSAATQLRNRATAMRAGLGSPNPGVWGKPQEEFFVQQVLDWVNRGVATDPDMNNAFEHFRNWLQLTQKQRTVSGMPPIRTSPQMQAKLDRMFQRPGVETVPYSNEQEVLRQAGRQVVRSGWEEAHATQYYKHDRSAFERSINHPYIGLYPASYMWGKILPEMVRFLALRPFGMTTPFLAWNVAREISDTIRVQSQNDPSWKKFLDDNKQAFLLMSMMFPATPNDIPANASLPVRRIAEQGLDNEALQAKGLPIKPIDYTKGAMDAVQYAVGPLGTIRTVSEVAGMGGELLKSAGQFITGQGGNIEDQSQAPVQDVLPVR